ncbi:MAG: hypothetical protein AAFN30_20970 [Actinomycetota bacterium]
MSSFPFLSDEWIEAARQLRARYADEVPPATVPVKLNVTVTDIPHRDGDLDGHIDATGGQPIIEQGHLDEPDLTLTIGYEVAKAAFVTRDQQAVMQAFFQGQILVDGDASQLMALQATQLQPDETALTIYEEMMAFTAED